MLDQGLFKNHFVGRDGFIWWIGQIADENTWKANIPGFPAPTNESTEGESTDERPDTSEFAERAMKADLSYPIIAIDYGGDRGPNGYLADYDIGLWIADGVHRIFKAKHSGHKSINAIIITSEELNNIEHEDL